jgi:UDPglucose 6-dehydrogenase
MKKVAMIGCGKLGLPCAEVMAEHYDVVGFDIQQFESEKVKQVSIKEAVEHAEIIFIAVPTPHSPEYGGDKPCLHLEPKDFNYDTVVDVLKTVNLYARPEQLVVLISTVLPGTVRREFIQHITIPKFLYNPYLIAMGSVSWDMVNPEMVIIGTETGDWGDVGTELVKFYIPLMQNNPKYHIGTWEEAEGIKIFYNTFISAKIGLVNMIQDVAEKVGHMCVDVVTDALSQATHRITGPAYMRAGMGDAGACHPRDNIALRWMAKELDLGYDLFHTIMEAREVQAQNMAMKLVDLAVSLKTSHVWFHGKAYKPHVPYIDGSYSTLIGHYVEQMGLEARYVDPLTGDAHESVSGVVLWAHHAPTTYGNTGTALANEQGAYCKIEEGSIILDPWRKLANDAFPGVKVVQYGNTR